MTATAARAETQSAAAHGRRRSPRHRRCRRARRLRDRGHLTGTGGTNAGLFGGAGDDVILGGSGTDGGGGDGGDAYGGDAIGGAGGAGTNFDGGVGGFAVGGAAKGGRGGSGGLYGGPGNDVIDGGPDNDGIGGIGGSAVGGYATAGGGGLGGFGGAVTAAPRPAGRRRVVVAATAGCTAAPATTRSAAGQVSTHLARAVDQPWPAPRSPRTAGTAAFCPAELGAPQRPGTARAGPGETACVRWRRKGPRERR